MPRIPRRCQWAREACSLSWTAATGASQSSPRIEDGQAFFGLLGRYSSRFPLAPCPWGLSTEDRWFWGNPVSSRTVAPDCPVSTSGICWNILSSSAHS
jgi:hypothetical protein